MPHVALIGDSIFDNGTYVKGGPDVCTLLRQRLPSGWTASLQAVDGSTAQDVPAQLTQLPGNATHIVLSVGGNDALMHEHILNTPVGSSAEALLLLATALDAFEHSYREMMRSILAVGTELTVCTIYNANFPDAMQARCVRIAIALFDDAILRVAREHDLKTIDLRYVCTEPADYANDIEPSVAGGGKLAEAIAASLGLRPSAA